MRYAVAVVLLATGAITANAQDRFVPEDRRSADVHYREGWRHFRNEEWQDAIAAFRKALATDETFELAYYGLGRSYMALKDFTQAAAAYEQCKTRYELLADDRRDMEVRREQAILALRESSAPPGSELGNSRSMLMHDADMATKFDQESAVPPFVSLALGSAYFRLGRVADAERAYKTAVADYPGYGEAHSNLAVVYLVAGLPEQAEQEVALAERAGFKVNPNLKADINKAKKKD
jgi:tetratricopeptide (TPR) repeat protein